MEMVHEGKVDILMKGMINTDNLLHVVLNKEKGILPKGRVLTHITAAKLAEYDKLLFFTDSAVIPYPTQEQRVEQVRYIADLCHKMGIDEPRIALNHCTEKVNEKYFPFTVGYQDIKEMARQRRIRQPCHNAITAYEVQAIGPCASRELREQTALLQHLVGSRSVAGRIEVVESVCHHAHRVIALGKRLSVSTNVYAIGQTAHHEHLRTKTSQLAHKTAHEVLPVGRAAPCANDAHHSFLIQQ